MSELDLDLLRSWEGKEETREDLLALTQAQMLAATLDRDPEALSAGDILPPLYHWLYFPSLAKSADLGRDGHAHLGEFMPPVPYPRRMFAGARVSYEGVLRIGEPARRVARIEAVEAKEGRSGPLVFVTVSYEISDDDGLKLREEQDIAYRPAIALKGRAENAQAETPAADFSREIVPDERLLFRFSALTFNAHRIHYDLPYCEEEGYPALVIHGPLTAVLLADLVTRATGVAEMQSFSFRARSAFFLGDRLCLYGKRDGDTVALTATNDKGLAGMIAQAVV